MVKEEGPCHIHYYKPINCTTSEIQVKSHSHLIKSTTDIQIFHTTGLSMRTEGGGHISQLEPWSSGVPNKLIPTWYESNMALLKPVYCNEKKGNH